MEPLWTPWRMPYIQGIKSASGCVFCDEVLAEGQESELLLHRGRSAFVVLNLYPYTTGHLMVVPYRHVGRLQDLEPGEIEECADLVARCERASARALGTTRLNIGINVGRCAGAGVEGHLHIHLVPHPSRPVGGLPPCGEAGSAAVAIEPPEPLVATRDRLAEAWRELRVPAEGSHRSNS